MPSQTTPQRDDSEPSGGKMSLSTRRKTIISLIVGLHVLAVAIEPLLFFTRSQRGASEAVQPVRNLLRPYTEFAYLNHGYFFFAPEPGPSHLLQCKLTYANGDQAQLRFPDKAAQWPRLLYHRHFMLAEFLHMLHYPPADGSLAEVDPLLFRSWQADRNRFEMIRESMQEHVLTRYAAEAVRVDRLEHQLPSSDDVLVRNRPLDDPSLYIVLPDAPPAAERELGGMLPGGRPAPLLGAPIGEEVKP